jgi:GT2 family glycosyltransferase
VERVLFAPRALPPLRPDVAHDPAAYAGWMLGRQELRSRQSPSWTPPSTAGPRLHLVLPIVGEPPVGTIDTLESLQHQTIDTWALVVVLQQAWHTDFTAQLAVSGVQRSIQRVRVEALEDGTDLADLVRAGFALGAGDPVALIAPGDVWAPDAVAQLCARLAPSTVVYGDDDDRTPAGSFDHPRLKPDYSPDFLLTSAYLGRPMAIGASLVPLLQPSANHPGLLDHEMALQACESASAVVHVPEVLCHRARPNTDEMAPADDGRHVAAALGRRGETAQVVLGPRASTYRIRRSAPAGTSLSVVIPFRDQPRFLRTCVESIDATRGTLGYQLVLIDNGSVEPETATLLERLDGRADTTVLTDDRPFNWAELNNVGAAHATGDVVVFLNNDIEAKTVGWLDSLAAHACRPDVGAVGARLLYPDGRLQHCGVVIGLGGAAGHILVGLDPAEPGYLDMAISTRECAAVTGACLATRRSVFDQLGGFDQSLGIDLNDVDYCLRAQLEGYRVLIEPSVELTHYESPSRGTAGDVRDIVRFIDRWEQSILAGDPYLNPHLTRVDSSCAGRGPAEEEWWHQWRANLSRAEQ